MLAISPNASSKTDRLEASSKRYNIPISSFSIVVNYFMGGSFLLGCQGQKENRLVFTLSLLSS
jgi:hypothetical protein